MPQYLFLEIAQSRASFSQFPNRFSRTNSGTLPQTEHMTSHAGRAAGGDDEPHQHKPVWRSVDTTSASYEKTALARVWDLFLCFFAYLTIHEVGWPFQGRAKVSIKPRAQDTHISYTVEVMSAYDRRYKNSLFFVKPLSGGQAPKLIKYK